MALHSDWLSALAAFEAAARHQNFAHAAEELHLTASAVSHHVRRLEARLGLPLFRRHARGVRLTAEGRQLADAASGAIADIDGVISGLKRSSAADAPVRITTLHSFASSWLIPRLPEFARAHPEVRLSIDTGSALTRFDDSGPDFGIRYGPGRWPGLVAHPLLQDSLFPVASPAMAKGIKTPAQVARLPLISDLAVQGWRDWCRIAGLRLSGLDERYVFSDSTDMLAAAEQGLGAALARSSILGPWLRERSLVQLPGPELPGRYSYHVVYAEHRRLRPAARTMVDWLLAQATA
ncbi:LysR substrate-binding domain-containing protein [Aquimonas sp.]|jgi:LysR family glycine cleavage system transcriptional activator|uniref:LysR substrate-binding domain-containing protein n=1 Tax=Aquimonas sp. TaxID=1872588 RepID=UPI0037BE62F2